MSGTGRGRLLFVNYHYIRGRDQFTVGAPGEARFPGIHPLAPEAFADQIAWLSARFHMAFPEEAEAHVLNRRGQRTMAGPGVVVTFDDGLVDHWDAADILEQAGTRGVFFVTSRPLKDRLPLVVHKVHWLRATTPPDRFRDDFNALLPAEWRQPKDPGQDAEAAAKIYVYDSPGDALLKYRINFQLPPDVVDEITTAMLDVRGISAAEFCDRTYLDAGAIQALSDRGHMVAAHGHSHTPFSRLGSEDLAAEIGANVKCLEDITGVRPRWVSYPFGRDWAVPQDTGEFCRQFGFSMGLTLKAGWNHPGADPTRLARINTNEVEPMAAVGVATDA